MEYYYGFGNGRYNEVLDELRIHGRVNSCCTSTFPLVEFWQPANLEKIAELFRRYLGCIDMTRALKYFEFPTEAVADGIPIGRPSMTDLMILDGAHQIAIEAKYTEYSKMHHETLSEWLAKAESPRSVRRQVAECWLRYILEAGCSRLGEDANLDMIGNVCYQFLHRAASACFKTKENNGPKAVLIYQLFYDYADTRSINNCNKFKERLRKWAEILQLTNMNFLIMSVPVVNAGEVKDMYEGVNEDHFEVIKRRPIYKFDLANIIIDNPI